MEKARVTRLRLTGRFVFVSWRELCVKKAKKRQAIQRAIAWQRGSLMRRGWLAWKTEQRSALQKVVEADGLFCRHVMRKWQGVSVRAQVLKSRTAQFVAWRKARCLAAWNHAAQLQKQGKRRVKEMQATWHARRIRRALQGWCEYAEGKCSLEARCVHLQQKRALGIKRWGWRLFLQQRSVKAFRERRVEGIKGAVLKAWAVRSFERKRRRALVGRGMQRVQRNRMKRAFLTWRMTSDEGKRMHLEDASLRFAARISDLETGLSSAEKARGKALSWLEEYQAERRALLASAALANARTPVWSSGMLDAELRWRNVASVGGPSPRSGHSAVALFEDPEEGKDGPREIVVFGGWNGTDWFDNAHLFNSESQAWSEILPETSAGPSGRSDHCSCAIPGGRMLVLGGFDGSEELADLHVLSVSEDGSSFDWTKPDLGMGARPGPLSHATCCLLPSNRHVAVFGGYRSGSGLLNELWVLDLEWWQWSQPEVAGDVPRARRGHVMEALGDVLIVHGGYDGQAHLDDLYVLDLNTMVWRKVDPVGDVPAPRRGHVSTVIGRYVLIHGGFDGTDYLDDVYNLDVEGYIWLQRAPMVAPAEHSALVEGLGVSGRELREMDPNVTQQRTGRSAAGTKSLKVEEERGQKGGSDENGGEFEHQAGSEAAERDQKAGVNKGRRPDGMAGAGRTVQGQTAGSVSNRAVSPDGRAFHQAVFDGHRVVLIGGAHSHSILDSVLLLENSTVEDGRALARAHLAALDEGNALRNECMRLERQLAAARAEGLGFRGASERLTRALRAEAQAKKAAVAAQRVLGQKLKKARAEGAELEAELSCLEEQLQSRAAECHLTEQHLTSAQKALQAREADHQKALFQAASTFQEERLRSAARIAELEARVGAYEREAQQRGGEIEGLKEALCVGEARVEEMKAEVRRMQGVLTSAEEEAKINLQRVTAETQATTRALERRLQEQEAELERALQGAREEATGQAEASAQTAVQTEQQRAERLGERIRVLEKERGEERRFVESYRRERDAAEAARREAEAMRAEALEYARAMENRCREELARMEEKVRLAGLVRWQVNSELRPESADEEGTNETRRPVEVLLEASLGL